MRDKPPAPPPSPDAPRRDRHPAEDPARQFRDEVFPAEFEEIRRRRRNAADPRPPLEGGATPRPSVDHDLTGLALSGGGIRSAAFSLGVLQRLLDHGALRRFDYVSTVSGGGFAGSSLSALMAGDTPAEPSSARLLLDGTEGGEAAALNHIRNGSNYLAPPGLLNQLRLPALLLVGVAQVLMLAFPLVVLAVLVTEILFDLTAALDKVAVRKWLPLVATGPLVSGIFWRPLSRTPWMGALRNALVPGDPRTNDGWLRRDGQDRRLGGYLLLALLGVLGVPLVVLLEHLVTNDVGTVTRHVSSLLVRQTELHVRGWLLWASLLGLVVVVVGAARFRARFWLWAFGATGPLFLLGMYLVLCVTAIRSPLVRADEFPAVLRALEEGDASAWRGAPGAGPKAEFEALLVAKGIDPDQYRFGGYDPGTRTARWRIDPGAARPAPLWRRLSTESRATLTASARTHGGGHRTIYIEELSILGGNAEWWLYLLALALGLYNVFFVDVNLLSHHQFYRDRLSRTFVISPTVEDAPTVTHRDEIRMSELSGEGSTAPYHLFNTALNLQGSDDAAIRDRRTVPLTLSKHYCGSAKTGYCATADLEEADPALDLATAMAISAAAAAPNMGALHVRSLTLALTLLNVRIGYWLPNPRLVRRAAERRRGGTGARDALHRARDAVRRRARAGLLELLREATGLLHDRGRFVNCTDGGHIENLGVYGLLQRRCRTILCVDAEADPELRFAGLTTLERYANIDLNTKVDVEVDRIRKGQHAVRASNAAEHCAPFTVGPITYPDGSEGTLIYLKLGMTPLAPEYIRFYAEESPCFPHEATSSQFFGETQFEVYRRLGSEVAKHALADPEVRALLGLGAG